MYRATTYEGELHFSWISPGTIKTTLLEVQSSGALMTFTEATFDDLLCDIWSSEFLGIPRPTIGLANLGQNIAGLVAIRSWPSESCESIDVFALSTSISRQHSQSVSHCLIEAVCDQSLRDGYYGWIACYPSQDNTTFWTEQKFSRHEDASFRRLGYFV